MDKLDGELERRGLKFCRFADDCQVFVGSQRVAERVLSSIIGFIERKLKLKVNRKKSKAEPSSKVKFLGITIQGLIGIASASMKKARETVKQLVPRRTHAPLEVQIYRVNQWYTGWTGYFGMTNLPAQLRQIEARIRLRFRRQFIRNQKGRRHLADKMIKRRVRQRNAYQTVYRNDRIWVFSPQLRAGRAWSNAWF